MLRIRRAINQIFIESLHIDYCAHAANAAILGYRHTFTSPLGAMF
jgi:hypothetical protein